MYKIQQNKIKLNKWRNERKWKGKPGTKLFYERLSLSCTFAKNGTSICPWDFSDLPIGLTFAP